MVFAFLIRKRLEAEYKSVMRRRIARADNNGNHVNQRQRIPMMTFIVVKKI